MPRTRRTTIYGWVTAIGWVRHIRHIGRKLDLPGSRVKRFISKGSFNGNISELKMANYWAHSYTFLLTKGHLLIFRLSHQMLWVVSARNVSMWIILALSGPMGGEGGSWYKVPEPGGLVGTWGCWESCRAVPAHLCPACVPPSEAQALWPSGAPGWQLSILPPLPPSPQDGETLGLLPAYPASWS